MSVATESVKALHDQYYSEIISILPNTEQIRNNNRHQLQQTATSDTLQRSTRNQHLHTGRSSTNNRAKEKPRNSQKQDGFPSPDIRKLGPDTCAGGGAEKVRSANPRIPSRGVEVCGDCWDRCSHDRLI